MSEKSTFEKILIYVLAIFIAFCVLADAMFLVIKFLLPEKSIFNTFNVNDLIIENENGEDENLGKIFEFNYYANKDNSGIELFEGKLNYLVNEESNNIFTSGIQVVGGINNSISTLLEIDENFTIRNNFFIIQWGGYDCWYKTKFSPKSFEYNFDGNIAYPATLPISNDNYFLITIGKEQYRLKLKGNTRDFEWREPSYYGFNSYNYYYNYIDFNYLSAILFESIKQLPSGFDGTVTFKFGDYFDYLIYNEEKQEYETLSTNTDKYSLVNAQINNYYTIRVKTYYSGATSASDSMFGVVAEDYNFNLTNFQETSDYLIGKKVIELNQYDFTYEHVDENYGYYNLRLKDNVKVYLQSQQNYLVRITLELKLLNENNILFNSIIYDDVLTEQLVVEVVKV